MSEEQVKQPAALEQSTKEPPAQLEQSDKQPPAQIEQAEELAALDSAWGNWREGKDIGRPMEQVEVNREGPTVSEFDADEFSVDLEDSEDDVLPDGTAAI